MKNNRKRLLDTFDQAGLAGFFRQEIDEESLRSRLGAELQSLDKSELKQVFELCVLLTVARKTRPTLTVAPELYVERADNREDAPTFIQRVYGDRLDGSFSRVELRRLDPKAYAALNNWEQHSGLRAPFLLPTKAEANDSILGALGNEDIPEFVRTYNRLRQAQRRRQ